MRKCSGCTASESPAWYCTPQCQKTHWPEHRYECGPARELTTADHLVRAVHRGRMPDDTATVFQYGLAAAWTKSAAILFEVYVSVIRDLGVSAKKMHQWRLSGPRRLHSELVKRLELHPGERQRFLHTWLAQKPWIFERLSSDREPTTMLAGIPPELIRQYASPALRYAGLPEWYTADDIRNSGMPDFWYYCFCLYVVLLPPHLQRVPGNLFDWVCFGFCTCYDDEAEMRLCDLYGELLDRCSFDEFYAATRTASLASLFNKHGLGAGMRSFPNLEDMLRTSPVSYRIVYLLKQYVLWENVKLYDHVARTFGFAYCRGEREMTELKGLYRRLFVEKRVDPLVLHQAAAKGRLYEVADESCGFRGAEKALFRRLLKEGCPKEGCPRFVPEDELYGYYYGTSKPEIDLLDLINGTASIIL
ncbi:hypothetical protein EVJ58_g2589 [Rhodofomes roseus]|uniref:MYND-type domain-containing protein n=1 Tax=Rhodofomes roseus TaxID=34475 RepID=A0A4Y9YPH8_9APHY|nr:hypothetical protein EVJ58_g2589 [Rhodofomes roseus]